MRAFTGAYAAWQDNDRDGARDWIAKARAKGNVDPRLERFEALLEKGSYRNIFYSTFCRDHENFQHFKERRGFDVRIFRQFQDSSTRVLATQVTPNSPADLVLIDNLSLFPIPYPRMGRRPPLLASTAARYSMSFSTSLCLRSTCSPWKLDGGKFWNWGRASLTGNITVYFYPIPIRLHFLR